jgi:hypothetical protein
MDDSPSPETNSSSDNEKLSRILWSPKFHYGVHIASHVTLRSARLIQSKAYHPSYVR